MAFDYTDIGIGQAPTPRVKGAIGSIETGRSKNALHSCTINIEDTETSHNRTLEIVKF